MKGKKELKQIRKTIRYTYGLVKHEYITIVFLFFLIKCLLHVRLWARWWESKVRHENHHLIEHTSNSYK